MVYRAPVRHQSASKSSRCQLPQVYYRKLLRNQFGEDGMAMCCRVEGCNLYVDPGFRKHHLSGVVTGGGVFQYPQRVRTVPCPSPAGSVVAGAAVDITHKRQENILFFASLIFIDMTF